MNVLIDTQAIAENMPLVSSDSIFQQYQVNCVWKEDTTFNS